MKTHRIGALLILCAAAHGDAREELAFARKLSARGHTEMAAVHLTKLSKSSDRKLARAGKYGLALLDRQNAQRMRNRFLGALQADSPPPVSRSEILRLYADAVGDVKSYVESAREHLDARFQYGELLQEYAEFLAGRNYPDRLERELGQRIDIDVDRLVLRFHHFERDALPGVETEVELEPVEPELERFAPQYHSLFRLRQLKLGPEHIELGGESNQKSGLRGAEELAVAYE